MFSSQGWGRMRCPGGIVAGSFVAAACALSPSFWLPTLVQALDGSGTRAEAASPASSTAYRKVTVNGIPLHVVQVDARSPQVRLAVVTPGEGLGTRENWGELVDRARPVAALTGTHFCTTSSEPIGSIVVGGRLVHHGPLGTVFSHVPGKGARVVSARPNRTFDWKGSDMLLRSGPRLLTGGQRTLAPRAEGFRDPELFRKKARTAVAITPAGKLLLVAVTRPVLLRTLADALKELGAVDAMCLDGGGSTGLYYGGKTRIKPNRPLTNVLVVYDSPARYAERAGSLNPAGTQIVKTGDGKSG